MIEVMSMTSVVDVKLAAETAVKNSQQKNTETFEKKNNLLNKLEKSSHNPVFTISQAVPKEIYKLWIY